jgi:hypothetical protein
VTDDTAVCLPRPNARDLHFKIFPRFDDPEWKRFANLRHRYLGCPADPFPGDGLPDRLGRALVARRAIVLKEILESFELYARVRRRVRRAVMSDLCCGHGLTGLLFALCEKSVDRVLLVDEKRPDSYDLVLEAVCEVGPWVASKVSYVERPIDLLEQEAVVPDGAAVLVVHGCGALTDLGLGVAIAAGGPVAVMPCCYRIAPPIALRGLKDALGKGLATDIARTCRLAEAGYHVDWSWIPSSITPMNRVLVAWHPP